MGFDWETILGAEGAALGDAYDSAVADSTAHGVRADHPRSGLPERDRLSSAGEWYSFDPNRVLDERDAVGMLAQAFGAAYSLEVIDCQLHQSDSYEWSMDLWVEFFDSQGDIITAQDLIPAEELDPFEEPQAAATCEIHRRFAEFGAALPDSLLGTRIDLHSARLGHESSGR